MSDSTPSSSLPVVLLDETVALRLSTAKAFCGCIDRFNRNRWERPWYMYWSAALESIFTNHGESDSEGRCYGIFPAPQFPFSLSQLVTDSKSKSDIVALPDFCMIYLSGRPSPPCDPDSLSPAAAFAEECRGNWRIDDVAIILMVELKPLDLSLQDLDLDENTFFDAIQEAYKHTFHSSEVQNQVFNQAIAFFSDPDQEHIDAVVSILAVDDVWGWAKIERLMVEENVKLTLEDERKGKGKPKNKNRKSNQLASLLKPEQQVQTKLQIVKAETAKLYKETIIGWSDISPWDSPESDKARAQMLETLRALYPGKNL